MAAVCVRLGLWQLARLEERRAANARIEAGLAAPPADAASVLDGTADPAYRRVTAEGTYLVDRELLAYGRSLDGRPGDHVLTPMQMSGGGPVLLVDRGWVPFDANRTVPAADAATPDGAVAVVGVLLPPEQGEAFPQGEGTTVRAIDPEAIGTATGLDLAPWYLLLQEQRPPSGSLPIPARMPALSEGPHLSYAIQWFSFAAIALIGYGLLSRRGRRRRASGSRSEDRA